MRGLARLALLVCIVFNLLLAIWIFTDIRKRGEGSGIFIALALVAGFPAAILYSLVRIGDKAGRGREVGGWEEWEAWEQCVPSENGVMAAILSFRCWSRREEAAAQIGVPQNRSVGVDLAPGGVGEGETQQAVDAVDGAAPKIVRAAEQPQGA